MTDIKPALTPKEWEDVCVEGECRDDEIHFIAQAWHPTDPNARTVNELPHHRIAALALHGQPFGFTREDVAFLRLFLEDTGTVGEPLLRSIIARIEALLPPEPTP
jgi:hypothetical protein